MASGFFVVGTNSFLGVLDLWVTGAQWKISQTILYGRDAILRVRGKWLIFNIILQLWADVKYHVPTGFGFSPKASGFYSFGDATALAGEGGVGGVADSSLSLKSQTKGTVLLVCGFLWFVIYVVCLKSDMPQH